MAETKLRVGLIGCGGISWIHLSGWKKLNPQCECVALCDLLPDRLLKRGTEFNIPKEQWYTSHKDMLAKARIDAVDICVPNMGHAPITIDALNAGKHVICEKPLAPSPALIQKMIVARDKNKKILMTAQHMRFERGSEKLKGYIDTGALGDIYYARSHFLRRRYIPGWGGGLNFLDKSISGGGPTVDIGVHILDLSMFFMGHPEPVSVSGIAPNMLGKRKDIRGWWGEWDRDRMNVEDFAAGFVRFKNGATLSLECSFLLNMKEPEYTKIWLFGTDAGAEWPALTVHGETAGVCTDTQLVFNNDKADGHEVELEHFRDAVLNRGKSPVPAEQSLNVLKILDGIYRSYASGKEVKV